MKRGAKVVFGDVNVESERQVQKLSSGHVKFLKTDVTKYSSVVALFDLARKLGGRIDVAVSNAGLVERGNWVGPELSLDEKHQLSCKGSFAGLEIALKLALELLLWV